MKSGSEKSSAPIHETSSYLAAGGIKQYTHRCLKLLEPFRAKHPLALRTRPCLLVVDAQRHFFDPASPAFLPIGPHLAPYLQRLVDRFRASGLPVVFTQHIDNASSPMTRWWKKEMGPRFRELILDSKGDVVVRKHSYDAFFKTSLEKKLRRLRVNQLVIAGVMSHLCVDTTARSAFARDFAPVIAADAVGGKNEWLHLSALMALAHGFAFVTDIAELEAWIAKLSS